MNEFGKTAILCRPDQLIESAIAVSCLPPKTIPVVLVLEPAPMTPEKYREAYAAYMDARRKSMGNVVGFEYRMPLEKLDRDEIIDAMMEHQRTHQALTEPRSWLKRNGRYRQILKAAKCETVLFLFSPGPHDLKTFYAVAENDAELNKSLEEWEREDLVPKGVKRILLMPSNASTDIDGYQPEKYQGLSDLSDVCRRILRPADAPRGKYVELSSREPGEILASLARALESGMPLHPASEMRAQKFNWSHVGNENASEAVLVEASDAASIAGVIYSAHRQTALFVIPKPDLTPVNHALDGYNNRDEQAREAISRMPPASAVAPDSPRVNGSEETRGAFSDFLKSWLFGDGRREQIQQIESAVSAILPEPVVSGIGERCLTAFTEGVPYQFVRSANTDWTKKTIGHVVSDKSLVVYSEIVAESGETPDATFAAVFDPGYFTGHSETKAVLEAMDRHSAYPLLFNNEIGSLDALMKISAGGFSLDLVFFLTHGTDQGILLGDLPVYRHQIVQWVSFETSPIVFNNSCLSWVGVGREFIRVGARGYIGTLWSVNSEHAADLARTAIVKIVQGEPVAQAIRSSRIPNGTELAYIFVGTATSRLRAANQQLRTGERYCLEAARSLLERLVPVGGDERADLVRVERYFHDRVVELLERPELQQAPVDKVYPLRQRQLEIVNRHARHFGLSYEKAQDIANECFRLSALLGGTEKEINDRNFALFRMRAAIHEEYGDQGSAIADYESAESLGTSNEKDLLWVLIPKIDSLKEAGAWDQSRLIAEQAKELAEKLGERRALMGIVGQLAQLSKRMNDADAALRYAAQGYQVALELHDPSEQVAFKIDEAQILMQIERYPKAAEAAEEAGKIARANERHSDDLAAHGVLTGCYLRMGKLAEAEQMARNGLKVAIETGNQFEQASFLMNLAEINSIQGKKDEAVARYRESANMMINCGRFEFLGAINTNVLMIAVESKDWAKIAYAASEQLLSHTIMPLQMRGVSLGALIRILRGAFRDVPGSAKRSAAAALFKFCEKLLAKSPEAEDFQIAHMTFATLGLWLEGSPEAAALAVRLDLVFGQGDDWSKLVKSAPRF